MTNTTNQNLTTRQARSAARSLVSWGAASNVRVVEAFHADGSSSTYVLYDNRCGMPRSIETVADLIEAREAMA